MLTEPRHEGTLGGGQEGDRGDAGGEGTGTF